MSRLDDCFAALRARGERALIPFVTSGDPDLGTTAELVLALADAGADAIELGVPFSDPLADGPTIQRASERALRSGASLRRVLELVKGLRPRTDIPVILMGYANSFYTLGADAFAEGAREAGVDGLICVDLPPEEGEDLMGAARRCGIDPVLLAAPTTRPERLAMLADRTRGFLYYVSLTGVTSARARVGRGVEAAVRQVRKISEIPVCVGFGVSKPEHAAEIGAYADGVVVGSALIDRLEAASSRESAITDAAAFVAALKQPLRARS
ncbi:MAG: tryptophan synthase subunit alpha [Deltaproteobacteria bacterium]|nr:tryptophan synthase subunit alpha [Deltaproteobacteria bacterium]